MLLSPEVTSRRCEGRGEVAQDEIGSEAGPSGKMILLDCTEKGGGNRAKKGSVEKGSQVGFGSL